VARLHREVGFRRADEEHSLRLLQTDRSRRREWSAASTAGSASHRRGATAKGIPAPGSARSVGADGPAGVGEALGDYATARASPTACAAGENPFVALSDGALSL